MVVGKADGALQGGANKALQVVRGHQVVLVLLWVTGLRQGVLRELRWVLLVSHLGYLQVEYTVG